MIKLCDKTILILKSDGSKVAFEADELASRIIKSCLANGIRDSWISEDIALAIEYALSQNGDSETLLTTSDINAIVVKILENTGFPEVAEHYLKENSSRYIEFSPDYKTVSDLIRRHLGVEGDTLESLSSQVIEGVEKLGLEAATPTLLIELAKSFRSRFGVNEIELADMPERSGKLPWSVSRESIIEGLQPTTVELLNSGILNVPGISRLFPTVKIDFRICRFTRILGLDPPVTELALLPHFDRIAEAVNDILEMATILHLESEHAQNDLPVYMSVPDMSNFATECLHVDWPDSEVCCRDIVSYLEEMIDKPIFKLSLK